MAKPRRNTITVFREVKDALAARLVPPFGIILGSPFEVANLVELLPPGDVTCYQMDLYQARRLTQELDERGLKAQVAIKPDLWDLDASFQTLIYPVPYAGERALKLDMVEQAYHTLAPQGTLVVLSPYDRDQLFQEALKKVFGKVHVPMNTGNAVFWSQRQGQRDRRRHEITFQARVSEATSYRFISRPGVFGYGHFDDGARALVDAMEIAPGHRVVDLGCGIGTNGIIAARHAGPEGSVTFVDSNARALALAELNAHNCGVANFTTVLSSDGTGLGSGGYDVVLANPPYFAQLTIARNFIEQGYALLKPNGLFFLVTKHTDAIYEMIQEVFGDSEMFESRGYIIFRCVKAAE